MGKMKLGFAALLAVLVVGLVIIVYGCNTAILTTSEQETVSTTTTLHSTKSWGTPARIGEEANRAQPSDVVIDDSGNAIVVWSQLDGTGVGRVYADRYVAGSGWGTPEVININNGSGDALGPQIALDGSGNAIAVWLQKDGAAIGSIYGTVYANRYVAGSGWGAPEVIGSGSGNATFPDIAMNKNGDAIAGWGQKDNGTGIISIYANRYRAGSGWGTATVIENDDTNADEPEIAVDSSGNAIALWTESDGTNDSVHANRYAAGSGWGTAANIGIVTGGVDHQDLAMDKNGNAIAVWDQSDGTVHRIYTNRYAPGAGWGTAITLENEAGDAFRPKIAIDGSGNAIVVWDQQVGSIAEIWAKRYTSGSWDVDKTVISNSPLIEAKAEIAMNEGGDAMVVWQHTIALQVWAKSFTSVSWGTAEKIDGTQAGNGSLLVAINKNGDAVAVWSHGTGVDRGEIYANQYH